MRRYPWTEPSPNTPRACSALTRTSSAPGLRDERSRCLAERRTTTCRGAPPDFAIRCKASSKRFTNGCSTTPFSGSTTPSMGCRPAGTPRTRSGTSASWTFTASKTCGATLSSSFASTWRTSASSSTSSRTSSKPSRSSTRAKDCPGQASSCPTRSQCSTRSARSSGPSTSTARTSCARWATQPTRAFASGSWMRRLATRRGRRCCAPCGRRGRASRASAAATASSCGTTPDRSSTAPTDGSRRTTINCSPSSSRCCSTPRTRWCAPSARRTRWARGAARSSGASAKSTPWTWRPCSTLWASATCTTSDASSRTVTKSPTTLTASCCSTRSSSAARSSL
mmetsp:Transcript_119042/g.342047  ORF Transcript_119042/g.342047 Transcript_119042/m.342047 type:complete len:339 (+) Transcript_119042:1133-2149(+)